MSCGDRAGVERDGRKVTPVTFLCSREKEGLGTGLCVQTCPRIWCCYSLQLGREQVGGGYRSRDEDRDFDCVLECAGHFEKADLEKMIGLDLGSSECAATTMQYLRMAKPVKGEEESEQ